MQYCNAYVTLKLLLHSPEVATTEGSATWTTATWESTTGQPTTGETTTATKEAMKEEAMKEEATTEPVGTAVTTEWDEWGGRDWDYHTDDFDDFIGSGSESMQIHCELCRSVFTFLHVTTHVNRHVAPIKSLRLHLQFISIVRTSQIYT